MVGAVGVNDRKERGTVLFILALTHAVDAQHILRAARRAQAHIHQRLVAEHDVGRQSLALGGVEPQLAQLVEQLQSGARQRVHRAAALRLRCAGLLRLTLRRQLDQHLPAGLQRGNIPYVQHGVLVVALHQISILQQLGQQAFQRLARGVLHPAVALEALGSQLPQTRTVRAL